MDDRGEGGDDVTRQTERIQLSDGRVIETEVRDNAAREIAVARVHSLSPPMVVLPGRQLPVRIHARAVGLTVGVGDLVLCCRVSTPAGERAVAMMQVEVLG